MLASTQTTFNNLDVNINPSLVKSLLNEMQLKFRYEQVKINQIKKSLNLKNENLFEKIENKKYYDNNLIEAKQMLHTQKDYSKNCIDFVQKNINFINDSLKKRIDYNSANEDEINNVEIGGNEHNYLKTDNNQSYLKTGDTFLDRHASQQSLILSNDDSQDTLSKLPNFKSKIVQSSSTLHPVKKKLQTKTFKDINTQILNQRTTTSLIQTERNDLEKFNEFQKSQRIKKKKELNKIIDQATRKGTYLRSKANVKILNKENKKMKEKSKIFESEPNKDTGINEINKDFNKDLTKVKSKDKSKDYSSNHEKDENTILRNNDFLVVTLNNERHFVKRNLIPESKIKQKALSSNKKLILNRTNSGKVLLHDLAALEEDIYPRKRKLEISYLKKDSSVVFQVKPKYIPNATNFSKTKSLLARTDPKYKTLKKSDKLEDLINGDLRKKFLNSEKMKALDWAIEYELDQIRYFNREIESSINLAEKTYLKKTNPFNSSNSRGKRIYIDNSENNILGI